MSFCTLGCHVQIFLQIISVLSFLSWFSSSTNILVTNIHAISDWLFSFLQFKLWLDQFPFPMYCLQSGYAYKVYSCMTGAIKLAIYFIYPWNLLAPFISSVVIRSNCWSPCNKIYYLQIKFKHVLAMEQVPTWGKAFHHFLKEFDQACLW